MDIDLESYIEQQIQDMEKDVDYYMTLLKKEIAIRYALLENAVNHNGMSDQVWHQWRENIRLWEERHGFIFEKGDLKGGSYDP